MCQSLFFNKVAGLRPRALLKNRTCHGCFSVKNVKFLKTSFFIEHLRLLLLKAITTFFSIRKASRNRVSGFSSLFLTRVKVSRSSRWKCSVRKSVLRNFAKFAGKHLSLNTRTLLGDCFCVSTNVSGVIRKSAPNCCLVAKSFVLFHIC